MKTLILLLALATLGLAAEPTSGTLTVPPETPTIHFSNATSTSVDWKMTSYQPIVAPKYEEVLRLYRPWICIPGTTVTIIRVTDKEWDILVKAYPGGLMNAKCDTPIIFDAPVKK